MIKAIVFKHCIQYELTIIATKPLLWKTNKQMEWYKDIFCINISLALKTMNAAMFTLFVVLSFVVSSCKAHQCYASLLKTHIIYQIKQQYKILDIQCQWHFTTCLLSEFPGLLSFPAHPWKLFAEHPWKLSGLLPSPLLPPN